MNAHRNYRITDTNRGFTSIASAKRELARQVRQHRESQRLMGRPPSWPHWGIYSAADDIAIGTAILYSDDDEFIGEFEHI